MAGWSQASKKSGKGFFCIAVDGSENSMRVSDFAGLSLANFKFSAFV
jgi:hypothetical protein